MAAATVYAMSLSASADSDATPGGSSDEARFSSDATPSLDGSDEKHDSGVRKLQDREAILADPARATAIQGFRENISLQSNHQVNLLLWEMLPACRVEYNKFQPRILGQRVSVPTWSQLLGVSLGRVYRLIRHLKNGHCSMPNDLRHDRVDQHAAGPAASKADAWLTYIYTCFAEPLAEATVVDYDESAPPAPPQEESVNPWCTC